MLNNSEKPTSSDVKFDVPVYFIQEHKRIVEKYNNLRRSIEEYQKSLLPRYVSIPKFFEELGLVATYEEMLKMGNMAASRAKLGEIKSGDTSIGVLYCFKESLLDECFDDMTIGK